MLKKVDEFLKAKRKMLKKDYEVRYDTINKTRESLLGAEKAFYDKFIDETKETKIVAMHEHSYYAYFLSENYPKAKVTWLSTGAPALVDRSFLRKGIKYDITMTPLVYPNTEARSIGRQDVFVAESHYFEPVLAAISILSFMELSAKTKASKCVLYCMAPIDTSTTSCLNAAWNMLYGSVEDKLWVVPWLNEDEFCLVRAYIEGPINVSKKDIDSLRNRCFTANHKGVSLFKTLRPKLISDMKTAYTQLVSHLEKKMSEIPDSESEHDLFVPEERMTVPSLVSSYMFFDRRTLTDEMRPSCYLPNLGDIVEDIKFLTLNARKNDKLAYFGCAHEDIPCVLASLFPEIAEIHVFGTKASRKRMCKDHDRVTFHDDERVSQEFMQPDLVISTKRSGWFQGIRFSASFLPRAISTDMSVPPENKGYLPLPGEKNLRMKKSGSTNESFLHLEGSVTQKIFRLPGSDECRVMATRDKKKYNLVWYDKQQYANDAEKINNMRFVDRHYVYGKVPPLPPIPGHDRSIDFHKYHATISDYLSSRESKKDLDAKTTKLMRSINKRIAPDLLKCVYRRWCESPNNKYSRIWLQAWKNRAKDYVAFMEAIVGTRGKTTFDAKEVEEMKKELAKMKRIAC